MYTNMKKFFRSLAMLLAASVALFPIQLSL